MDCDVCCYSLSCSVLFTERRLQCRIVQATAFQSFSRFLRLYVARRGENLLLFFLISHSITCFTNGADNESGEEGAVRDETAESRQRESLHWSVHWARTRSHRYSVLLARQSQGIYARPISSLSLCVCVSVVWLMGQISLQLSDPHVHLDCAVPKAPKRHFWHFYLFMECDIKSNYAFPVKILESSFICEWHFWRVKVFFWKDLSLRASLP